MDDIVDNDLIKTGQILELDRILILKLKYNQFIGINKKSKLIPQANLEKTFDWQSKSQKKNHTPKEFPVYQLSDSGLISHAWKKAPDLTIIENKKQLNQWNINADILTIFDFNYLESILIIPLFLQRESKKFHPIIIGFLILQSYQSRIWQTAEIEAGKWIAKQVATSIINRQTFDKVQSLVDERTAQLQVSLEVQAKLSQTMRHHIEELKHLNSIKDEFVSSLSDAFKTPLSNMKMAIKMLKLINIEEKIFRYLNILEEECDKEISLVNNLLTLEKIQANQFNFELKKIFLNSLVDNLSKDFAQALHSQKVELKMSCNSEYIYADFNSVSLIIKELINNACKFSVRETEINLQIYTDAQHNIIKIENYGLAIEEDEQELIFEPFYQGKQVENVTNSGTGLGLALVKSLVENLNGIIDVTSTPCAKSADYLNIFTLKFPQLPSE